MVNNITCALIAVARDEDYFLEEWIKHNLSLGFNHIYIADNNDFDKKLKIVNPSVTIIPKHDVDFSENYSFKQSLIYNEILSIIHNDYDYCAVCDIDEFFDFRDGSQSIQEFIENNLISNNFTVAEIPWETYDDNDLIFSIKNKDVQSLYTRVQTKMPFSWCNNECSWGKSIFKLGKGVKTTAHWPDSTSMDLVGGFRTSHIDKQVAVIKHYRTKSLEDYIKHKATNQNLRSVNFTGNGNILEAYFSINPINKDKLLWACRFMKDVGWTITDQDRKWMLSQFINYPLITVVIRTHNRLEKLKECYKSIINQSTCGCKILILDDYSTDNTSEWLSKQSNISYLSIKENLGPGEILARGKYLITTPYYIILDDDDQWYNKNALKTFYNAIIDNPYSDLFDTGYYLHVGYLVSTELLINCPNLSLWCKDDWYFKWINRNAKNKTKIDSFKFYNWSKLSNNDTNSATDYYDNTFYVSDKFYDGEFDNIKENITENYHKGSLRERLVYDQIMSHLKKI